MKTNHRFCTALGLCSVLLLLASSPQAEVYRWVDENGKTHYSDKKPKSEAEDITEAVKKQNIDTSIEEQRKLQEIFRPENDADREYYRQQQLKNQPTPEHIQHCNKQRRYLSKIDGRVQFVDEEGNVVPVTEKQRQQRVEELQRYLVEHCS
jgi:hypothetical protein